MADTINNGGFDAYSAEQIADLSTGMLAELKMRVDAEVAKRLDDCKLLMPVAKKRASRKKATK